jgi:hypothetical protein
VKKAVVKLRLAQADAPRALGVDGARVAQHEEDRARASLLRGVLRSLTRVQKENSLVAYKEAEAEVASCVGALASRLARLDPEGVFFPGGTASRTDAAVSAFAGDEPRRAGELVELACVEYARAATLARRRAEAFEKTIGAAGRTSPRDGTATNAARAAAKASLRFALHCEATLSSLSSSSSALGNEASLSLGLGASSSFPPPSARGGGSDATAENAFHPEGLEPTLTRHALLALAGGAGARARHLIPRVLALLRGDGDRQRASAAARRRVRAARAPRALVAFPGVDPTALLAAGRARAGGGTPRRRPFRPSRVRTRRRRTRSTAWRAVSFRNRARRGARATWTRRWLRPRARRSRAR